MAATASDARFRTLASVLCLLVFASSLLVLLGWTLDLAALKGIFSRSVTMRPNVAVGLMLSSLCLGLLSRPGQHPLVRQALALCGVLVALLGSLSLSQDIGGWDLGMDQWLFHDPTPSQRGVPGRMSALAAFCFMLLGVAGTLAALGRPRLRRLQFPLLSGLAAGVGVVGVASVIGGVVNAFLAERAWNFVPLASDTALAFIALAAALLALVRSQGGLHWVLDRWTTRGFGIGIVLLLAMAAASFHFTRQLQEQAERVNHNHQVLAASERLARNLADIATGLRGYLIVGDPALLGPRAGLKAQALNDLERLRQLTADDARQQRRLAALTSLVAERFAVGDRLAAVRASQGFAPARESFLGTRNVPLADDVRRVQEEIRTHEYALLSHHKQRFNALSLRTFLVLPLAAFGSATLLLLGIFFLNRGAVERNRSDAQLAAGRSQFKTIFDNLTEGVVVIDMDRNEVVANPVALSRFGLVDPGLSYEDAVNLLESVLLDGTVLARDQYPSYRAMRGEFVKSFPLIVRRKSDGKSVVAEFDSVPILDAEGNRVQLMVTYRDVTLRREAEKQAQRLTRFYAALSQTNQALVRVQEIDVLYQDICRICVDFCQLKMAFIALVQGEQAAPAFFAGPAKLFLAGTMIPLTPHDGQPLGPMAMAITTGQPYICNDFLNDPATLPWRERASYLGTRAVASFPFRRGGQVVGAMSLHAGEMDFFTPELIALVTEMMGDLSFALDNLEREAARAEADKQLRLAVERFRQIFLGTPEGMSVTEIDTGRFVLVNDAYSQALGYSQADMVGRTSLELGLWVDMAQRTTLVGELKSGRRVRGHELQFRARNGHVRDMLASADTIELDGQTHMLLMFSDITERKHAAARIDYLANHDELTGLPNRNLMHDRIAQAVSHARRGERQMAVMYLDLDRFKTINDGYGQAFGDQVLRAAAHKMQAVVRECDTLARQAGDEFVVLLTDLRKFSDAFLVAQKVLDAFARPLTLDGREVYATVSIGVSVYPQNGESADELVRNANVAMQQAKELGRNTYQFFSAGMSEATQQQFALETRLRTAIAQQELSLVYQPKVDLRSGRIVGCEALLRWNHPELGQVSPARFIPIAEESGLIVPIGDWVLQTACSQNQAWAASGLPPVIMSVNVSARQFLQQDVAGWVFRTLEQTGMAPQLLDLELTESLMAQDAETVIDTVADLKAAGVKVSIDDFGTGYSSLSYLKRFRVNTLKIDQSFVRTMLHSTEDAAIPLAVIAMAHSLGLTVVAEGVETAEQCAFLREKGCEEMQGFYFSKPVSAEVLGEMLKEGKRLEGSGGPLL